MAAWDPSSNGYDGQNAPNCHMNIPGGTGTNSVWAPIDGVTNVKVTNSHLYDNDACGLQVFGASNVLIDGNALYSNGSGNGSNPTNPTGMNGEGAWWADTDGVTASHNNAYGNRVGYSGNDGSGLDADTRTSNNLIEYNYLHDNANYGFSLIDGYGVSETTVVRYNVFANNGAQYSTAPDIMVSRPYPTGSVDGLQIYNNTLYNTHGSLGIRLQSPFSGTRPNEIRNNLIFRRAGGTPVSTTTADATSDNNLFYASSGSLGYVYNGTSYSTLNAYRCATGQDQHSLTSNPSLSIPSPLPGASMPTSPSFSVGTSSPAIGAGTILANNGGIDFYGAALPTGTPTIGAVLRH
ncbi:MAG: right-handed parallel beta-helix repeat-containing protein [Actinobacteria bacterium]|nr:right-handed parallel beta-helix repeat-containing protein [Actinomycetota bacterium]